MPQQKPKKPPGVPPEVTAAREAWAKKQRAKKTSGATASDRAKFAPGRGGLGAMARKEKARRATRNDAHVQEYYRWKNRQR